MQPPTYVTSCVSCHTSQYLRCPRHSQPYHPDIFHMGQAYHVPGIPPTYVSEQRWLPAYHCALSCAACAAPECSAMAQATSNRRETCKRHTQKPQISLECVRESETVTKNQSAAWVKGTPEKGSAAISQNLVPAALRGMAGLIPALPWQLPNDFCCLESVYHNKSYSQLAEKGDICAHLCASASAVRHSTSLPSYSDHHHLVNGHTSLGSPM